jgi:hypothetical protein
MKKWTSNELSTLKRLTEAGKTPSEIQKSLPGRSENQIGRRLWHLKRDGKVGNSPRVVEPPKEGHWRREAEKAHRALQESQKRNTAVEVLVDIARELAPVAYDPPKFVIKARKRSSGTPQSAVLMFSDTHIGKIVTPDQTLGMGGYNFELFLRRLNRMEQSVHSIIEDHTTTEVPEIVIPMLGDMLDGNLAHAVEAGQQNTLFTQFYNAGHAIAQFFRNLSAIAPLRIHTAVGNHTRWGNQHKMPTENRFSNLDQFLYAYIEALLRGNLRIKFNLDKQPFALFDVQGHHFYAGHGDTMKGGDKALGVPNHAIGRTLSTTAQSFALAGKQMPHYFLYGHFHRPISLPHARGEVIINGGFPGLDGYALMSGFNPSRPSQKMFFVHPKFGKTASYDLQLDRGDSVKHSYELPANFPAN